VVDTSLKLAMKGEKKTALFACVIIDETDQLNSWKLCVKEF
jgi:hypothetical protein